MKPRKGALRAIAMYALAKWFVTFVFIIIIVTVFLGGIKKVNGEWTFGRLAEHRAEAEALRQEQEEKNEAARKLIFSSDND